MTAGQCEADLRGARGTGEGVQLLRTHGGATILGGREATGTGDFSMGPPGRASYGKRGATAIHRSPDTWDVFEAHLPVCVQVFVIHVRPVCA